MFRLFGFLAYFKTRILHICTYGPYCQKPNRTPLKFWSNFRLLLLLEVFRLNPREMLRDELKGIYNASTSLVKRLRRRGSHVIAGRFTEIALKASKLHERNDLLLPTYRRRTFAIRESFEAAVKEANSLYPAIFIYEPRSSHVEEREVTKTVKVSITLPIAEWDYIDHILMNGGDLKNRSEYFRNLHFKYLR